MAEHHQFPVIAHHGRISCPFGIGQPLALAAVQRHTFQSLVAHRGDESKPSVAAYTPNGDDEDTRYIWASISPDGTRILYHVSSEGTYVCDLEGENVQFVAFDCLAPQWYDDNTIVGMKTRDDDLTIASSAIVAYTLDGARQQLTSDNDVLLYPFCSSQARRIVCARGNGEMVVLNVSK